MINILMFNGKTVEIFQVIELQQWTSERLIFPSWYSFYDTTLNFIVN